MKSKYLIFILILFGCQNINNDNSKSSVISENENNFDKSFYSVLYNLTNNSDFQLSRSKIEKWNYVNFIEEMDYTIHFFNSFQINKQEFEQDFTFVRYFTTIDYENNTKTDLVFKKENGIWNLTEKKDCSILKSSSSDFETFIFLFSKDTIFSKEHIKLPLKNTYINSNDDLTETTEYLNKIKKYNFLIDNKLMFFHDNNFQNSKNITIYIRGIDNGLSTYFYFEKIENNWFLVEENDMST